MFQRQEIIIRHPGRHHAKATPNVGIYRMPLVGKQKVNFNTEDKLNQKRPSCCPPVCHPKTIRASDQPYMGIPPSWESLRTPLTPPPSNSTLSVISTISRSIKEPSANV